MLLWVFFVVSYCRKLGKIRNEHIEPVMFHGIGAGSLEVKLHKAPEPLPWCFNEKKHLLWINIDDIVPYLSTPCFLHNLQVKWDKTTKEFSNNEGVEITTKDFGGTEGVEYLTSTPIIKDFGAYLHNFVQFWVDHGYERSKSIRTAMVDWRVPPQEWTRTGQYERIKNLIEDTYKINGNTKVHLMGHSMGGPTAAYFLSHIVDQKWKEMYIASFFSFGGSYDGGYSGIATVIYGKFGGLPVGLSSITEQIGGVAWQSPYFRGDKNRIVVYSPHKNYTLGEVTQLYRDMGIPLAADLYDWAHGADPTIPPNVTTHCFQGIGFKTPRAFYFKELKLGTKYEVVDWFPSGDGTVFPESYGVCGEWKDKQKAPVRVHEFLGLKYKDKDYHRYMPSDPAVQETMYDLIYGAYPL